MHNENQELEYHNNNFASALLGLLVGGLAGALTVLLLAPQTGEETRMQIQEKGIELRDRTTGLVDEAMAQIRLDRKKFAIGGRRKARQLLHKGQELVVEQLDHVSDAAQAGKKAIREL
jgi:gas vesicle protein